MSYSRVPAAMDGARQGAGGMGGFKGPRNIQFMLTRMTAYSKNTIRLLPQTKSEYQPGDTIVFRLPASALLDMSTFTLKFDWAVTDVRPTSAGGIPITEDLTQSFMVAAPPRFNSGFFRRVDVSMGSTSVGLTGLHDYGALSTLLYQHCVPHQTAEADNRWVESGEAQPFNDIEITGTGTNADRYTVAPTRAATAIYQSKFLLPTTLSAAKNPTHPMMLRNFLGLLGGTYFRFLDTNLLPEVTISFTIAPKACVQASRLGDITWQIQNASLNMESVNFGDGVYRSLVDQRLATGDLVLPFANWVGFEGQQTKAGTSITQFTVATKSLNGVIGTFRRGNYDAQRPSAFTAAGGVDRSGRISTLIRTGHNSNQQYTPGSDYYQFMCGLDALGLNLADWKVVNNAVNGTTDIVISGAPATGDTNVGRWLSENGGYQNNGPVYQFTIDSKLYPQFLADVVDSAMLVKNFFDAGGLNLAHGGNIGTLRSFLGYAFMFAIGLDHHSDNAKSDNLISGLDTRNSQIPITFTAQRLSLNETLRPTIFAALTSTLVIGPDRIISTVL